ncbi:tRNA pseudouridine(55) synthase TruB [Thiobacillus denitrificans]|uniref:tRNA pseudouridine synthase B n=1 Tax=Thiobacillus denitrificans TaxID=36861 RepID=A0A106BJ39_THIDE|nr:tRNA pseudouridine(55) synthase TruB [Thiobacillus denitrificans]KVW93297.1 pseudouridine synthase [Thiobacillus denitrificans]
MKPPRQPIDGVLLLNKPVGITSNAALQKAKWLLNAKKAGHTGTLDPFADGLLPLCFGEATKFSAYLLEADKHYRAVLQLGVTTTTGDPEGEVLSTREVTVSRADISAVLPRFTGEIEQIPPMHSALKHQGRPLYEYARAGIEIDRPPRKVTIRALELIECDPPRVVLDVQCSAGTYIRTLAQDIGAVLGCGAHLTALTRTTAGGFTLGQAHTLTVLEALEASQRHALLLPADCLVAHLPAIQLDDADAAALCQGRSVPHLTELQGLTRIYTAAHVFIGLADADAGQLLPRRLIATQQA